MAIRVQKLEQASARRSRDEWEQEVELTVSRAAAAAGSGDMAAYGALWDAVLGWDDVHRRQQAIQLLFYGLQNLPAHPAAAWSRAFALAGHKLNESLRAEPHEPATWSFQGVILYEFGERRAAMECLKVCAKMDPDFPNLKANMRAGKNPAIAPGRHPDRATAVQARAIAKEAARLAASFRLPDPRDFRLSLVMIVKDEEEMLPGCLASVAEACDEMIIVDTGSTDRTVEIARSFGATVIESPWQGSFAQARNVSLDHATGDWVLQMDADEQIVEGGAADIRPLLAQTWREAFSLIETSYTGEDHVSAEYEHEATRIWRHRPEYRFEGAIHEQKAVNMPLYLPRRFAASGIRMIHFGYTKDRIIDRDKNTRNLELLLEEAETDANAFNRFNIGTEYMALTRWEDAKEMFIEGWEKLEEGDGPAMAGFAPMLAARLVDACVRAGDLDGAERWAAAGLAVFADHTELVHQMAVIARARGDLAGAAKHARQALEMGTAPHRYGVSVGMGTHRTMALLAAVADQQGDRAEAIRLWRAALKDDPKFTTPLPSLASALLASGADPSEVLAELLPHAKATISTTGVMLADILLEHGHPAQAREAYEAVLADVPESMMSKFGVAECALALGEHGEIDRIAERIDPQSYTAGLMWEPCLASALARAAESGSDEDARRLAEWAAKAAEAFGRPEPPQFFAWFTAPASEEDSAPMGTDVAKCGLDCLRRLLRARAFKGVEHVVAAIRASEWEMHERENAIAWTAFSRGYVEFAADAWAGMIDAEGPTADSVLGMAQVAFASGEMDRAYELAQEAAGLEPGHEAAGLFAASMEHRRA